MTNEMIYKNCCNALVAYARENKYDDNFFIDWFNSNPGTQYANPVLAALAPVMLAAREGIDKSTNGKRNELSALKRIIKASARDDVRGGWTDKEGRFCVCSGYHAVRLNGARYDSLPTAPGVDLSRVMARPTNLIEIVLPSISDCKAFVAERGKSSKAPMPIDGGKRWINPSYLIDILQILPGAVAVASKDNFLGNIYFDHENGDGCLCVCRAPEGHK